MDLEKIEGLVKIIENSSDRVYLKRRRFEDYHE